MTFDEMVEAAAKAMFAACSGSWCEPRCIDPAKKKKKKNECECLNHCEDDARAALLAVLPSARAEERERCAKVADSFGIRGPAIASAIRALTDSEETGR